MSEKFPNHKHLIICGVSYGGNCAIALGKRLKAEGKTIEVITINSAPSYHIADILALSSERAIEKLRQVGSALVKHFFTETVAETNLSGFASKASSTIRHLRRVATPIPTKLVESAEFSYTLRTRLPTEEGDVPHTNIAGERDIIVPRGRFGSGVFEIFHKGSHAIYQTGEWIIPFFSVLINLPLTSNDISKDGNEDLSEKIKEIGESLTRYTDKAVAHISVGAKLNRNVLKLLASLLSAIDPLLVARRNTK